MRDAIALFIFLVLTVAVGGLIGWATAPGEWYAGLAKPAFNPPNWIFGPVWTTLYVLIAVAGWLVWRAEPSGTAMKFWVAQLLLNWAWSPVFFSMQAPSAAVVVILLLLAAIAGFIVVARNVDLRASWLFLPYAAWVGFAAVLNISIARLN